MRISIGPFDYMLVWTDQHLLVNRRPVLAICDHQKREVLLSETIDPDEMPGIMGEVVSRIWRYRFSVSDECLTSCMEADDGEPFRRAA